MTASGSNREAFLARVRQAAEAGRTYRVACREIPDSVGVVGSSTDLCAALAREVNEVGGRAQIADDFAEARHLLAHLLRSIEPRTAICWRHPVLDRLEVNEILRSLYIRTADYDSLRSIPEAESRAELFAADVGITSVSQAIAETGTLVMCALPGQERLTSLLPLVHLAIVLESQIVPDLFDTLTQLRLPDKAALPSNVTLITGPSKTGDIELQLTTGVHGPGRWHVLIVRETKTV